MERRFSITIRGRLSPGFADVFGEVDVSSHGEETLIAGRFIDQAHLDGILMYLRNLGFEMIAVNTRARVAPIDRTGIPADTETSTEGAGQ